MTAPNFHNAMRSGLLAIVFGTMPMAAAHATDMSATMLEQLSNIPIHADLVEKLRAYYDHNSGGEQGGLVTDQTLSAVNSSQVLSHTDTSADVLVSYGWHADRVRTHGGQREGFAKRIVTFTPTTSGGWDVTGMSGATSN